MTTEPKVTQDVIDEVKAQLRIFHNHSCYPDAMPEEVNIAARKITELCQRSRTQATEHEEAVAWQLSGNVGSRFYTDYEEANKWMALDGMRGKVDLIPLYLRPPQSQSVRDALERAAQICEERPDDWSEPSMATAGKTLAKEIRALIEQSPPAQGGK